MNAARLQLIAEAQGVRAHPEAPVPSPCRSVCTMDASRTWCTGCLRTLDEIAGWGSLPDAGKRAIWARLEQRARNGTPSA